ncbi:MAG TPA: ABC transporter ATP-binding protein [Anaeromyxobacteraceae bacterium]|nr:ABC transporter ATP-binding protein [Anaeromyxobacteraceae bacterium]
MSEVLAFQQVSKSYPASAGGVREVLRRVDLRVDGGRVVALVGRSGSGKSTLLHLAAGIDAPTSGEVRLLGRELGALTDGERTRIRRDAVGLVFQFFHLLPHLPVLDNVLVPALVAGDAPGPAEARARDLLERIGLGGRERDPVQKLSGGEMQRVAICRALLRRPRLLLADEPTGNLDEESGERVMELLLRLAREEGSALLYATHSREVSELADEIWLVHAGAVEPLARALEPA